jgi:hypothetical protein
MQDKNNPFDSLFGISVICLLFHYLSGGERARTPIFIRRSSPRPTISIFKLITIVKTPPHTLPPSPPRVITAADIALDAIVVAPNIAVAVFTVRGHCFWMSWCRFFWVSQLFLGVAV